MIHPGDANVRLAVDRVRIRLRRGAGVGPFRWMRLRERFAGIAGEPPPVRAEPPVTH